MLVTEITRRLLFWYKENARQLPWRESVTPYRVWVSEIMLQQTRVETVIPYFLRWMERFPTVVALAEVEQQAVLQLWEGLGYYSRARNLHRSARLVVEKYAGQIPYQRSQLEALPGIGRYTAGAIASIAFGQDEPAVDGNLRRVFARLFDIQAPLQTPESERQIWNIAEANLPSGQAGIYNQALMDLGALICRPRNPLCASCPLSVFCQAHELGVEEERPIRKEKPTLPHLEVTAAIIIRDSKILLAQRPAGGLLGGMWEFPGGKLEPSDESLQACLQREIEEELGVIVEVGEHFGTYQHAYTHFRITLHAFCCRLNHEEPQALEADQISWVSRDQLPDFPMGKIDRQIATQLQQLKS